MSAVNRRWLSESSSRTRLGGEHDKGKYATMNEGDDIDEDDTTTTDATTARTQSTKTTNSKRSSTTKQTTLNFNNNKKVTSTDDDDDVDDKTNNNNSNDNSRHNVADNSSLQNKKRSSNDGEGEDTADPQRVFGSIVIDRERLTPPSSKRARGGDVEARGQRSWVHQAFSIDDGANKHVCEICSARLEPGGGGTSTRRNHYEAMHSRAFVELEATAAQGGNAAAFAKIVNEFKPKTRQLRHGEEIPVKVRVTFV